MASSDTVCLFTIIAFYLCALDARTCSATCTRRYSPPPDDDCSSVNMPCFFYHEEGSGMNVQLENPDDNTRTCYRTCIEDEEFCQASLTRVHNQVLHKNPDLSGSTLQRIFSPNYNDGRRYRKSTICKYNVRCEAGKHLSYNFLAHSLEERSTLCGNDCVDYVKVSLPNFGGAVVKSCGREVQLLRQYMVGRSALNVDFLTNRHEQDTGFLIFVWCSDPGFDTNAQNDLYTRRKRNERGDSQQEESQLLECTQPSNAPRPTVDSVEQIITAIPECRAAVTSGTAERIIMNEDDTLTYSSDQIRISWGRFAAERAGTREVISSSIRILYVSNRIEEKRSFRSSARGYFQGYGELWISGYRAYLLQLGVNPIYRPTDEETEIIMELQMALQEVLKDTDYFDVYDELDEVDPEEERGTTPPENSNTAAPNEALNDKALLYGTACNGLLRTVACAYQAKIMNRNCITGQMINDPTNTEEPTSEPTDETTSPTDEITRPTEETTRSTRPTVETTRPTRPTRETVPTRSRATRPSRATRTTSQTTSSTSSPPRRGRRTLNLLQRLASSIYSTV